MITSGTNTYLFRDGSALIICGKAGQCACGRTTHMFKNQEGSTHCLACEHLVIAPTEGDSTDDGPDAAGAFQKAIV